MSLIFDRFKSRTTAEAFAKDVRERFCLAAKVYDSQDDSDRDDWFPSELTPPIVLVDRDDDLDKELEVEAFVTNYQGHFAGT